MNYESIFNYLMYSNSDSNLNSNSSESSYDPRVTIFFTLSDLPTSYDFNNITLYIHYVLRLLIWSSYNNVANKILFHFYYRKYLWLRFYYVSKLIIKCMKYCRVSYSSLDKWALQNTYWNVYYIYIYNVYYLKSNNKYYI